MQEQYTAGNAYLKQLSYLNQYKTTYQTALCQF
jgi:hypothetical protein